MKDFFKTHQKDFLLFCELLFLLVFFNFAFLYWIRESLPRFIQEKNDTAYVFQFDHIDYSFLNNHISLEGIVVFPKESRREELTLDFEANIARLDISGVDFIELIRHQNLFAAKIAVTQPEIVHYAMDRKDSVETPSTLNASLKIATFELVDANLTMYASDRQTLLGRIDQLSVGIDGVNLTEKTLEKKIPFAYQSFEMRCEAFFYWMPSGQWIKSNQLLVSDNEFQLKNFEITAVQDSVAQVNFDVTAQLLPEVKAPKVVFDALDWGFEKDAFYFLAKSLQFDALSVRLPNALPDVADEIKEKTSLFPFKMAIDEIVLTEAQFEKDNAFKVANIELKIEKLTNEKGKVLTMDKITLDRAEILQFVQGNSTKKEIQSSKNLFQDSIVVKQLSIQNANYAVRSLTNNHELLFIKNLNLDLDDVKVHPISWTRKIPFDYGNLNASYAQLDYHPNAVYHISTEKMNFVKGRLSVNHFKMKPKLSRSQFVRSLKREKDLFDITAKHLLFEQLEGKFIGQDFSLAVSKAVFDQVDADIYRSKIPPDDPTKKPMYSQLLRNLPFYLKVDELRLKNAKIAYEEETEKSDGAGELLFSNFNAQITNIHSGFKQTRLPDVEVKVQTDFMNDAKLATIWTFNPMDRTEKFRMKGSIHYFDAQKMSPFIQPYLHVSAAGKMKEIRFDFIGNDREATGDFGMQYEDLKITLYHPETGKPRKFLTSLGNLALKNNTGDEFKTVELKTVQRKQDRSFFNFFWLCVQQGLKQTILVI